MTLDALSNELQETVGNFRQHLSAESEKTNKRVDQLEAIIQRASMNGFGSTNAESVDIQTKEGTRAFPLFRKGHSIVQALHGNEGVKTANELSVSKMLRGVATGNWNGADGERELMSKGQSIAIGGQGGFLLPELVDSMILDIARPASVVQRLGGGFLNVEGFTALPQLTGDVVPHWRVENQEIAESELAFGRVNVQPRSVGFLIRTSRELLEDAGPGVEPFFRTTIGNAYASALDHIALSGNGVAEPTGITEWEGVNTDSIGGAVDWDDLVNAAQDIYAANFTGNYSDLGVVLNPRTAGSLAKLKGSANDHYLAPPEPIREMRRAQTTHIPIESTNTKLIVGDFTQVAIAQRVGLSIAVTGLETEAFKKNQVLIRGIARLDVVIFRPAWFSVLTGITN